MGSSQSGQDVVGVQLLNESGVAYGVKHVNNKPRVSSMPYLYDIGEGNVADHTPWSKMGYNGDCGNTEEDLWSVGGAYVWPASAQQMEVVSSNNTQDKGTVLFSGNSTSGSTTTLVDTGKNFLGGTPVAVGDTILLDTSGAFGIVTGVAATTLAVAGGFSNGASGASNAYRVLDYSAYTGVQAVRVQYLNASYVEATEFVVLNGTTVVPTTSSTMFRINSFRAIAVGSGGKAVGNIDIRNLADTPIYSRIVAGYTQSRNICYTVPTGKRLYITSVTYSAGASVSGRSVRFTNKATYDAAGGIVLTPGVHFMPFTEMILEDNALQRNLEIPTGLPAGTDLKVSVISPDGATYCGAALRGWLETD